MLNRSPSSSSEAAQALQEPLLSNHEQQDELKQPSAASEDITIDIDTEQLRNNRAQESKIIFHNPRLQRELRNVIADIDTTLESLIEYRCSALLTKMILHWLTCLCALSTFIYLILSNEQVDKSYLIELGISAFYGGIASYVITHNPYDYQTQPTFALIAILGTTMSCLVATALTLFIIEAIEDESAYDTQLNSAMPAGGLLGISLEKLYWLLRGYQFNTEYNNAYDIQAHTQLRRHEITSSEAKLIQNSILLTDIEPVFNTEFLPNSAHFYQPVMPALDAKREQLTQQLQNTVLLKHSIFNELVKYKFPTSITEIIVDYSTELPLPSQRLIDRARSADDLTEQQPNTAQTLTLR